MGSDDMGAIYGALGIHIFTSDEMIEWKLGSEDRPLGQAVIYCKQADGNYFAAFCCAIRKEAFYDQLTPNRLEQVVRTAKIREIDIIFLGERDKKENCEGIILEELAEYDALYNQHVQQ
jgi:hypothetical protein